MSLAGSAFDRSERRAADVGRRVFLRFGAAALTSAAAAPALAGLRPTGDKSLALHNLHTGETVRTIFWSNGRWNRQALREIDTVLRDFRTGESTQIDRGLLDLLHRLARRVEATEPFHVISGYRSPKTNATLADASSGVAKRSLHMRGKAIDIRLPGAELTHLKRAAVSLKAGGVGFYPESDFIHIDTGRVRYW